MQDDKQQKKYNIQGVPDQLELSEIWQELLGKQASDEKSASLPPETLIPLLESDPWSTLIQANGIELVDLQEKKRLQISDQEVEQMLELMQEQSAQDDEG